MEPIHEDFHEADLFDDISERDQGSQSEDLEDEEATPADFEVRRPDELEESSAKSSLTAAVLDTGADVPQDTAEVSGEQLPSYHPIAASVPVNTGHVRMGSSVPVSIPHMNRWKKGADGGDGPPTQYAPATFVPPHQLSQVNEFMFSFTGDSPSVAIKRERLRVRNAILKSTGFLEPGAAMGVIGVQVPPMERNHMRTPVAAGGLSQALHGGGGAG
ncbi:hypothetical protein Agub_g9815, partial [Astrephomene gubernaculifera]